MLLGFVNNNTHAGYVFDSFMNSILNMCACGMDWTDNYSGETTIAEEAQLESCWLHQPHRHTV